MAIVEKIESIKNDSGERFGVYISSNTCTIQSTKFSDKLTDCYYDEEYGEDKIDATYTAVVKFVEWYTKIITMSKEIKDKIIDLLAKNETFANIAKELDLEVSEVIYVWNNDFPKPFKN